MASTLDALAARLVAQGVGALGTTIFTGSHAVQPAIDGKKGWYLTLRTYPGEAPEGTHDKGSTAYRKPRVQVISHALDYRIAQAKAESAFTALTVSNTTLSGLWFLYVTPLQDPFDMGLDAQRYARVGFNVRTMRAA